MEKYYPAKEYKCTQLISLKEYFSEFSQTFQQEMFIQSENNTKLTEEQQLERILDWSGVFDKQKRCELKHLCSITKCPTKEINIDEGEKSVKTTEEIANDIKWICSLKKRINSPNSTGVHDNLKTKQKKIESIAPGTKFAVSVRVYKPFYKNTCLSSSSPKLKFNHKIVLLGSQTLADLRDKIICINDMAIMSEIKSFKDSIPKVSNRKIKYPSGFLFINNVFYNDMRKKKAVDYSERLLNWAKEHGIDSLLTSEMAKTQIEDLNLRFGYPYVYFHQECCEHIFIFSSAWLLTAKDTLNTTAYPYYESGKPIITKRCNYCQKAAKWICEATTFLPLNRVWLCQNCVSDLIEKNTSMAGHYKLYSVPDESLLLDKYINRPKKVCSTNRRF